MQLKGLKHLKGNTLKKMAEKHSHANLWCYSVLFSLGVITLLLLTRRLRLARRLDWLPTIRLNLSVKVITAYRPYYVVLLGSVHRFNSLNNSRVLFSPPSESLSKVTSRGRRTGSNRLHHNWDNDHEWLGSLTLMPQWVKAFIWETDQR